jgi:hypothetical protein
MQFVGDAGREILEAAYCKVEGAPPGSDCLFSVRFTSLPHGFEGWLRDPNERIAANSLQASPAALRPAAGDQLEPHGSIH